MKNDLMVNKRIKASQLQIDLQHVPQSIYSAMSSFEEAFVLLDADLIIAFVNNKANEIIKDFSGNYCNPGDNMMDLFERRQQKSFRDSLDQALSGQNMHFKVEFQKNGYSTWLDCCCKPLEGENGTSGLCVSFKNQGFLNEDREK